MNATKLPWALRRNIPYDTGGWVIYSGTGGDNETVVRLPFGSSFPCPETPAKLKNDANAALIVRAVNTFDQAREALKDLVNSFEMDYMLDGVIVDRPRPEFVRLYRIQKAALAAMEAAHEL